MEEQKIASDGNVGQATLPVSAAPGDTKPAPEPVQPDQPAPSAAESTAVPASTTIVIQTPPTTVPKEELGTTGPKKRAPRKPAEPKRAAFSRTDDKIKGNTEEFKSVASADPEPVEQIDTSSGIEQQQQRSDKLPRLRDKSPDGESEIERRITEAKTSGGTQYVVSKGLYSRNNAAREAYDRIREKIDQRTGGWSKGRFK